MAARRMVLSPERLTLRALSVAAIGLGLGLLGCESSTAPRRPHILLITVDTLRADHTSLYGYDRDTTPRLRAFFAEGRIFERAYASEANNSSSVKLGPRSAGVTMIPSGCNSCP